MNIFKHELKMKKKSVLIWSISLAAFMIFYMAFYPAMAKDSQSFESVMNSFPKEMLQALGLREGLSLTSLMGFFTLTFAMLQLALAIQSSSYGFAILSEEERELTADFLLSKPVSRKKIYFSKLLAAGLALLITAVFVSLSSFLALKLFNGGRAYDNSKVLLLLFTLPIFQGVFLSLGMIISLLFKKVRSVLSFSMALSIGLYVINSIRGVMDNDLLGYFSPFFYFEPGVILIEASYDLKLFAIVGSIILLSLLTSYYLYMKRDIHSL